MHRNRSGPGPIAVPRLGSGGHGWEAMSQRSFARGWGLAASPPTGGKIEGYQAHRAATSALCGLRSAVGQVSARSPFSIRPYASRPCLGSVPSTGS
jgi:hypothetical protein